MDNNFGTGTYIYVVKMVLIIVVFCVFRWHSAGTFDVCSRTGGPFGTMRYQAELSHAANNGLDIAIRLLEPIKEQFLTISYADFYQVSLYFTVTSIKYIFNLIKTNVDVYEFDVKSFVLNAVSWSCGCWNYRRAWCPFPSWEAGPWNLFISIFNSIKRICMLYSFICLFIKVELIIYLLA